MNALHRRLIDAINTFDPLHDELHWPSEHFETLARALFQHQYTHNQPYRTLCNNRNITPDNLSHLDQIPAVPTDAFKSVDLFCAPTPTHTFLTSGTTTSARGKHHFQTLDVYRASLHPPFVRFCNPERNRLRLLLLAPLPAALPESSLSFMLGELLHHWGDDHSSSFITPDDQGTWHLDAAALKTALDEACTDDVPTMLLGTAFAFAEFFDRMEGTWHLPKGSRLMETGGFKGRRKELTRDELYTTFEERLGLPRTHCIAEYSMTELSSQTYTDALVSGDNATGRFFGPPWLKIQTVDPLTLLPFDEPGRPGLIRFLDLANVDSVMAVQTSDRGILFADGGLQLLGRAPDAELRGCSLTIEELVEKQ